MCTVLLIPGVNPIAVNNISNCLRYSGLRYEVFVNSLISRPINIRRKILHSSESFSFRNAKFISITRLRWAGHIVRMQDNMACKKITLDKLEGRRRAGRPNLRWMDGMMRDAEKLGIRNWRTKVRERDGWRRLLQSAKTLHGL